MAAARGARDQELLDAVDAFPRSPFDGPVWRIVRAGRDPLRPAAARGRWDDGTFEVLYTSAEADGARAEIFFHLDRGQPVFPTNVAFHLFELHLRLEQGLESANIECCHRLASIRLRSDRSVMCA